MSKPRGLWVILTSLVAAMMLSLLPLPIWAVWFRPDWLLLVLIYWAMALPHRLNVGIAWIVGLFFDVLQGTVLGLHAMSFTLVIYVVVSVHHRLRVFPLSQQAIWIALFIFSYQVILFWLHSFTGNTPSVGFGLYWVSSLTSALLWPWIFIILRDCRRRFKIA